MAYFGFTDLSAADLEGLASEDLMQRSQAPDEILASRFFAPKITDVSQAGEPPLGGYGWRNVIRLQPREGSPAASRKLESLYILFNVFQPSVDTDPFSVESKNNQAIVVRGSDSDTNTVQHPLYFFVYQAVSKGAKIDLFLNASFDGRTNDPETQSTIRQYFIPAACVQCHGKRAEKAKLNFLDTDHWLDRVQPGNDFAALGQSPHAVIFDGGKDENTDQFTSAMEVVRKLNQDIARQNGRADPSSSNFQLAAVRKWLDLHQNNARHVNSFDRGIAMDAEDKVWSAEREIDKQLLPLLNQYCYRCHSSIKYSVFDRAQVKEFALDMTDRLRDTGDSSFFMPQDRVIPPEVVARFVDLLKQLDAETE